MRPGGSRTSERSFLFISKRQATGVAGIPIALLVAATPGAGDDLLRPGGEHGGGVRRTLGGRCLSIRCRGGRLRGGRWFQSLLQFGHPLA